VICFKNVQKNFGNFPILANINMTIFPGERVSIIGPGGCGKSTLVKMILGLIRPTYGDIEIFDRNINKISEQEKFILLKRVGVGFQQSALFDFMTVRDNLRFAMKHMTNFTLDEIKKKIYHLLNKIKLPNIGDLYPYELSGGMRRRVVLARALGTDPILGVFDEPTAGLDPVTSTIILNMILQISKDPQQAKTLVTVTTNVETAIRFASRVLVIRDSQIIADDHWKNLLLNGDKWTRNFLSTRLVGLPIDYVHELNLPEEFIAQNY